MTQTPYVYHLNTTAYFVDSSAAETMTDDQLIHAAKSAQYAPVNLDLIGYAKKRRDGGGNGTLWGKVSA